MSKKTKKIRGNKPCPHCGKRIDGLGPIDELKLYIESHIERLLTKDKHIAYGEKNLKKWESWLQSIEELEKKTTRLERNNSYFEALCHECCLNTDLRDCILNTALCTERPNQQEETNAK